MVRPTNRDSDKFMLRLPDGMRERIRLAAESSNRSMNSEIVERLYQSFGPSEGGATLSININLAETDETELGRKLEVLAKHLMALNPVIRPLNVTSDLGE